MPVLILLSILAQTPGDPAPSSDEKPLLLGRLLGARSRATLRVGAWFGNLARGPNQLMFENNLETALGVDAPGSNIGSGTGILRDVGVSMTIGDYDFALSFLSDELLADATDTGDPIASAVLRKVLGEIRTRALASIVGAEVWGGVRSGGFEGPFDGSRFQIRDGQVYFGPKNDVWRSDYLAVEVGVELPGPGIVDAMYIRYLQFGVAHALRFSDEDEGGPGVYQSSQMQGGGLGFVFKPRWTIGDADVQFFLASIPFTGVAAMDYGTWGSIYGLLFTTDLRIEAGYRIDIGGALALRPFVAFQTELVLPFTGSFDLAAEGRPSVALPDYFFWGPLAGVEVHL